MSPPKKFDLVFVQHQDKKEYAQITQVSCPQDKVDVCVDCGAQYAAEDRHKHIASRRGAEVMCVRPTGESTICGGDVAKIASPVARLGTADQLVDVVVFDRVEPEYNGDPDHAANLLKPGAISFHIRHGVSNVRRAMTIGDRTNGTWWPRTEDADDKKGT